MNIKSLLLGSAAALLAVSGARAADAVEVVAEPEAVEYVRICDTYGAGFYYIPGTETCLRVGGFVRYQVNVGNELRFQRDLETAGEVDFDPPRPYLPGFGEASNYGWSKTTTASIQLDARTATEYGTLRAKIDARGTSSADFGIDSAFIELGGLHIGYSGNVYDYEFDGEQDALGGPAVNRIAYTYVSGSGLSATVSIDDDGDVIVGSAAYDGAPSLDWYNNDTRSGADFVPNVSANIRYASGPISAGLYGAYDNDTDNGVIKGIFAYSFSEADKLSLAAYWSSGPNYTSTGGLSDKVFYDGGVESPYLYRSNLPRSGEWSVQGEYWHRFNAALTQPQFRTIWNEAKAEVGLGTDDQVVPHILRHTCASRLVQGGIDLRRVQMWLGHQTLAMTMRYSHLATSDLDRCVDVLEHQSESRETPANLPSS